MFLQSAISKVRTCFHLLYPCWTILDRGYRTFCLFQACPLFETTSLRPSGFFWRRNCSGFWPSILPLISHLLLTCSLSSTGANYKASAKAQIQHKNKTLHGQNKSMAAVGKQRYKRSTGEGGLGGTPKRCTTCVSWLKMQQISTGTVLKK